MEIQGKILQVLKEVQGIGQNGNPWRVLPFIIETLDQFPRKVYIEVFGDERIKNCVNAIKVDNTVTVGFDIDSHEYNGRWYTSIRAWKVETEDGSSAPQEKKDGTIRPDKTLNVSQDTDLPF